jgi:Fe-S-cluster-containing dehydrogenase component
MTAAKNRAPSRAAISRRGALKVAAGTGGMAALAYALSPLRAFTSTLDRESFLRRHYRQLSAEDKETIFRLIEERTLREYGARVSIHDPQPMPAVKYGYALNLTTCIGCRQCAQGCHRENNHDRVTNNSYIRVFELEAASMELDRATAIYDHPVPVAGKRYMPVQCHHCDKPPCVDVCPVKATWKERDGLVVIDYNWCIGCRYCAAACPYHARYFNWSKPVIPAAEVNPNQGYLSNRIRLRGVMEKCTFCLHRTRVGRLPACLEACPAGARVFGNLMDEHSEIQWVLRNRRVFVLKEELGTLPTFFYYFAE